MEREPNHPEKQRAKWEEITRGPSITETSSGLDKVGIPVQMAEQIDIVDSSEKEEEPTPPEWVRSVLDSYKHQQTVEEPGLAEE
jgi:hypothetical protein